MVTTIEECKLLQFQQITDDMMKYASTVMGKRGRPGKGRGHGETPQGSRCIIENTIKRIYSDPFYATTTVTFCKLAKVLASLLENRSKKYQITFKHILLKRHLSSKNSWQTANIPFACKTRLQRYPEVLSQLK